MKTGAQPGNQNGFKGAQFREALDKALKRYDTNPVKRGKALLAITLKVVEKAVEGDMAAINMIADRLDGKPVQAISGPQGEPLQLVQRVIIQATDEQDPIEGEYTEVHDNQLVKPDTSLDFITTPLNNADNNLDNGDK